MSWDSFVRLAYGFNPVRSYGDVDGDNIFDTNDNNLGDGLSNEREPAGFRLYVAWVPDGKQPSQHILIPKTFRQYHIRYRFYKYNNGDIMKPTLLFLLFWLVADKMPPKRTTKWPE